MRGDGPQCSSNSAFPLNQGIQYEQPRSNVAPQAFDEDVVDPATPSIHRDLDAGRRERAGEGGAGELAALIGMKIPGLPKRARASLADDRRRPDPEVDG
jgi:hypothetical protein